MTIAEKEKAELEIAAMVAAAYTRSVTEKSGDMSMQKRRDIASAAADIARMIAEQITY